MLEREPTARWYAKMDTDTLLNLLHLRMLLHAAPTPTDYVGKMMNIFAYRPEQQHFDSSEPFGYMQGPSRLSAASLLPQRTVALRVCIVCVPCRILVTRLRSLSLAHRWDVHTLPACRRLPRTVPSERRMAQVSEYLLRRCDQYFYSDESARGVRCRLDL